MTDEKYSKRPALSLGDGECGVAQVVVAERKWEVHGFAGSELRIVGWNALLQHDTYTLPGIARIVSDYEIGAAVGRARYSGGFRWVFRSPELDGGRWSNYAGPFFAIAPKLKKTS